MTGAAEACAVAAALGIPPAWVLDPDPLVQEFTAHALERAMRVRGDMDEARAVRTRNQIGELFGGR